MEPLPTIRIDSPCCFSNVGVDYLGPLFVRHDCLKEMRIAVDSNSKYGHLKPSEKEKIAKQLTKTCPHAKDGPTKIWLALFTCLHSRAIHVEIVESCSTLDFLDAFRRFVGHCGKPTVMYSDNAAQFIAADKNLKEIFDNVNFNRIQEEKFDSEYPITWKFGTPHAPWKNGAIERLIGVLKRQLRTALQTEQVSIKTLQTLIVELKKIINDRPLSVTRSDPDQLKQITPNMLISGRQLNELENPEQQVLKKIEFADMWVRRKKILSSFWSRWLKDYLEQLSVNRRWTKADQIALKEGDVVILKPETLKKNQWNIGRITEIIQNDVGTISEIKVKTTKGSSVTRTIRQIALLEPCLDEAEVERDRITIQSDGVPELSDGGLKGGGQHPDGQPPVLDCPPGAESESRAMEAPSDPQVVGKEIEEKVETLKLKKKSRVLSLGKNESDIIKDFTRK
jgi:hypothetical protein